MNFTFNKDHNEYPEEVSQKVETTFKQYSPMFFSSVEGIDDGELYDPFSDDEFSESQTIRKLRENNCELEYTNVLGFNKSYVRFNY